MFRSETASLLRRFLRESDGATGIEYGIIAAGVGAAVASTVWTLGTSVKASLYEKLLNMF